MTKLHKVFAKMNREVSWDDLKIVAAIGAAGSLSGAARLLNTSHATVYRRLERIELEMGVRLFDRHREGYTPTLAGEEVLTLATRVKQDVLDLERRLAGQDLKPYGTVRVTTTDSVFVGLLAPMLAKFQKDFPDISLEVSISNRLYDLSKREADVAVRPGAEPTNLLTGSKVGRIAQAVYVKAGNPPPSLELASWIGADQTMHYHQLDRWMSENNTYDLCCQRLDSVMAMQAAARCGAGLSVLPLYLGEEDPALERITDPIDELSTDLWVLVHSDLQNLGRIKSFVGAISEGLGDKLSHFR